MPLLVPMARCLGAAGRLAEARTTLEGLLPLVGAADPAAHARLVATCAGIDHLLGDHAAATARLRSSLGELRRPRHAGVDGAEDAARGQRVLHRRLRRAARVVARRPRGRRACSATPPTAGPRSRCWAARTTWSATSPPHASTWPRPRLSLHELSDAQVTRHLTSFTWCGICEVYLERFDRSLAVHERCLADGARVRPRLRVRARADRARPRAGLAGPAGRGRRGGRRRRRDGRAARAVAVPHLGAVGARVGRAPDGRPPRRRAAGRAGGRARQPRRGPRHRPRALPPGRDAAGAGRAAGAGVRRSARRRGRAGAPADRARVPLALVRAARARRAAGGRPGCGRGLGGPCRRRGGRSRHARAQLRGRPRRRSCRARPR